MLKKILSILFILILQISQAQQKFNIQGTVTDTKDATPIPFVNVFLEGTTIGTQTDLEGKFLLKNISLGNHRLVASMIGYLPFIQSVFVLDKSLFLQVVLSEDIKNLQEVKIVGSRDKVWEKQYKEFERDFLGDINKKEVKVLNKEVIDFEKSAKIFTARANQPIIIENYTLGYKQTYILQGFEKKSGRIAYKGLGRYELFDTQNIRQKKVWDKNRITAYQGSLKHFLKALLNNRLKEEGFKAFSLNTDSTKSANAPLYFDIDPQKIISLTADGLFKLNFNRPIVLVYENEHLSPQYSEIKQLSEIIVSKEGNVLDPYSIEVAGKMSEKRIANLLPFDFELFENDISVISQQSQFPLQSLLQQPREIVDILGIKPFYFAGESIQLNATVKDLTKKISQLSIPLYVEFINLAEGKLLNRFILKVEEGNAKLIFQTLLELPTGNYQIRAYTNWMRNFSEEGYFKQNFTVFSQNYKKEIPISTDKPTFDSLIIHIEGGYLVEGLKSKIAIETNDNFGAKISVPFQIINNKNDTLINTETDSLGIAIVDFMPKKGEKCQIIVKNKVFQLPNTQTNGTIFTVDNLSNKEKIRVFVQTNSVSLDTLTLTLIKNGQLIYWKNFQNNKPSLLINIPKNPFSGVIQCFLVDKQGNELSERTIEIMSDEPTFDFLEKDKILLIKKPSHFLNFDKILKFPAEKGLSLKGKISRLNGKPMKKNERLSMVLTTPKYDTTKANTEPYFSDCKDNFAFQNLDFYGKRRATFIAPDNKVVLDTSMNIPIINAQKLPINWKLVDNVQELANLEKRRNAIILENIRKSKENIVLEEVVVKAKKINPNAVNGILPNTVIDEKRIVNQPTMSGILWMLMEPRKRRFGTGLKVFIDTQELQQADIDNIDFDISPSIVEKILIFEEIIPPTYGRAACAIVIVPRRGFNYKFKPNESYIVDGYHRK